MGNPAAMAEMIRTNPSMRESFVKAIAQQNPALGQQLSQNPALLDSFIRNAKIQVAPNHHIGVLTPEERCAIQRVSALLLSSVIRLLTTLG
jgi:hypothetical protein